LLEGCGLNNHPLSSWVGCGPRWLEVKQHCHRTWGRNCCSSTQDSSDD